MRVRENDAYVWKRVLFTAVPTILLLVFFARWVMIRTPGHVESLFAAALSVFLFVLLGVRFIPRWMEAWSGLPEMDVHARDGKRTGRKRRMHPFFPIVGVMLAFRLGLFIAAYLMTQAENGYTGGIFDHLDIWNGVSLDSRHYLNIAKNWYQPTGDDRLLLVFFPFYPIVVRLFTYVFRSFLASGLFVSNMCAVFSGYLLYELALLDMDRSTAMRSVRYYCLLPASLLLSAPMSDALFLLLSLGTMLLARKKRYLPACVLGFFAAFTRLLGVALFAPVCFELVADIVREKKQGARGREFVVSCVGRCLSLLLIPAGLGLYLLINRSVSGNAFQFLLYQKENWDQSLGWFFASAATQCDQAIETLAKGNIAQFSGLWVPNIAFLLGSLAVMAGMCNKLRPSYVAYFILYYALGMGASWLLSAPRYLVAAFPLLLGMGALTKKSWVDALATCFCFAGLVFYLYAFIQRWNVY